MPLGIPVFFVFGLEGAVDDFEELREQRMAGNRRRLLSAGMSAVRLPGQRHRFSA
jgi:hypothetical protein